MLSGMLPTTPEDYERLRISLQESERLSADEALILRGAQALCRVGNCCRIS